MTRDGLSLKRGLGCLVAVFIALLGLAASSAGAPPQTVSAHYHALTPVYDDASLNVQSVSAAGQRRGPPIETPAASGDSAAVSRVSFAAKAGPGAWGTAAESMSSRAAAYQARVTGGAAGSFYRVGGVKFDGFANGVLQEAKGPGYAKFVRNGQFQPWFSGADGLASQAQRQLAAAGGTPITWSVAESEAATAINNLFMSRGISGSNVSYVP